MHRLGQRAQVRQAVAVEHHLIGQGTPVGADRTVGQRGHSRAAGGDALVQAQRLAGGDTVAGRAFVGRRLDKAIGQGQRSDAQRLENRYIHGTVRHTGSIAGMAGSRRKDGAQVARSTFRSAGLPAVVCGQKLYLALNDR